LYISIPGFISIKTSIMDNILKKNVLVSLPNMLMFVTIILLSSFYGFVKALYNTRVTYLRN
jgi:hypothetical protein